MVQFSPSTTGYQGLPNPEMKMVIYIVNAPVPTSGTLDCSSSDFTPGKRIKTVRFAKCSLASDGTDIKVTWSGSTIIFGTISSQAAVNLAVWGTD